MNVGIAIAKPDFQARHDLMRDKYVNLRQEDLRLSTAARWLGAVNKKAGASSVAARNFLVLDSVHLLKGDWPERRRDIDAWDFTDIERLKTDYDSLLTATRATSQSTSKGDRKTPSWHEVLGDLKLAVECVERDTYPNYEAFSRATENLGVVPGKDPADQMAAYEKWLRRFRSYLVLGIPWHDVDKADSILDERIKFFLHRQDAKWGLEEYYRGRLLRYISDVRHEIQSSKMQED